MKSLIFTVAAALVAAIFMTPAIAGPMDGYFTSLDKTTQRAVAGRSYSKRMTTSGVGAASGLGGDGAIAGTATHDVFAFGFTAKYVQICIEASTLLADATSTRDAIPIYFRRGSRLTAIEASQIARPRVDILATTSAIFINGEVDTLASGAVAMSATARWVVGSRVVK